MPGNRLHRRDDVGHVGVFRLAKRRRHADVDRVEFGHDAEVGRRRQASGRAQCLHVGRRHIGDVRLATLDGGDFARVDVDAGAGETAAGKLDREGQPDVAQTDNAHAGLTLVDPLKKTFFADAHECASLSK